MAKMSFIEFAKNVLAASSAPLTAEEIWSWGCTNGLDKQLKSVGKTPFASLSAQLYVAAKKSDSGITAVAGNPKKFVLGDITISVTAPKKNYRAYAV